MSEKVAAQHLVLVMDNAHMDSYVTQILDVGNV